MNVTECIEAQQEGPVEETVRQGPAAPSGSAGSQNSGMGDSGAVIEAQGVVELRGGGGA